MHVKVREKVEGKAKSKKTQKQSHTEHCRWHRETETAFGVTHLYLLFFVWVERRRGRRKKKTEREKGESLLCTHDSQWARGVKEMYEGHEHMAKTFTIDDEKHIITITLAEGGKWKNSECNLARFTWVFMCYTWSCKIQWTLGWRSKQLSHTLSRRRVKGSWVKDRLTREWERERERELGGGTNEWVKTCLLLGLSSTVIWPVIWTKKEPKCPDLPCCCLCVNSITKHSPPHCASPFSKFGICFRSSLSLLPSSQLPFITHLSLCCALFPLSPASLSWPAPWSLPLLVLLMLSHRMNFDRPDASSPFPCTRWSLVDACQVICRLSHAFQPEGFQCWPVEHLP